MGQWRSRLCFRLRQGLHHGAEAAQSAAGKEVVVRGTNEFDGYVVRRVAVAGGLELDGFGAPGEKARGVHVVARHGFANFLEDGRGGFEVEGFAEAELFKLVGEDAEEVEV